jgi:hypothetical protein
MRDLIPGSKHQTFVGALRFLAAAPCTRYENDWPSKHRLALARDRPSPAAASGERSARLQSIQGFGSEIEIARLPLAIRSGKSSALGL